MKVDQRVLYTQTILRRSALNKYKTVLLECNQSVKDITGDKWTLGYLKDLFTEDFYNWDKSDGLAYDGDAYLVMEKYVNFDKDIWFELGKCMWRKHRSVFQDHLKYICNDIVKPFCVGIICCYEHVQEIHDPEKHLPPT